MLAKARKESVRKNVFIWRGLHIGRAPHLFQFRLDRVFAGRHVPGGQQHVGFAADLAVFNIALFHSSGRIHRGLVPLAAAGALKA